MAGPQARATSLAHAPSGRRTATASPTRALPEASHENTIVADGCGSFVRDAGGRGGARRADQFCQLHGDDQGQGREPGAQRGGHCHECCNPGEVLGDEQRPGPLHDLGLADRRLQGSRRVARLPRLRDEPDQARIGPDRARGHHDAARVRAEHRGHRCRTHPPDSGRRGRGSRSRRRPSRTCRSTAATSPNSHCSCPA